MYRPIKVALFGRNCEKREQRRSHCWPICATCGSERGLLREIAVYGAKVWYDTKTGPHFHFYREDREELFDIPEELIPILNLPAPEGTMIESIDVVVRLKSL